MTGRAWPYLVYLLKRGRVVNMAAAFGGYVLRHGRLPPLRAGIRTRLRRWMGRADETLGYPQWLEPRFERELHLRDRWRELQQPAKAVHPLHPEGYASLTGAFWPSVFESEDAGWTGVPVEVRAPLLDQRLLRFLLRVPPVPWCMNKEAAAHSNARFASGGSACAKEDTASRRSAATPRGEKWLESRPFRQSLRETE